MSKQTARLGAFILACTAAWSVVATIAQIRAGFAHNPWLDLAVTGSYVVAGLIAFSRRPNNRIGSIMIAVGVLWLSGNFEGISPALNSFALSFDGSSIPVTMHLIFAYPSGTIRRRSERYLIVGGYVALSLWLITSLLFLSGSEDLPTVAPFASAAAERVVLFYGAVGPAVFSVVAISFLVRRFVAASRVQRRGMLELWVAAAATSALVIITGLRNFSPEVVAALSIAKILIPVSLLVGLFRLQLARAAVGGLVVDLGSKDLRLREALARALGDPTLEIAYWVHALDRYIDDQGRDAQLPENDPTRAVTFVDHHGERLAALVHDPALGDNRELIEAATATTALALDHARLQAELRTQLQTVQESRMRIVEAADAERARIERNMHDGAQQRLLSLSFALRGVEQIVAGSEPAQEGVRAALSELDAAMSELRELARGIHPAILDEEGLGPALGSLAERAPVPTQVTTRLRGRLPSAVEVTAYFVVAESLANIAKYAHASKATLGAAVDNGSLRVEVTDNGRGGADPQLGSGLRGLADRVAALGGELIIESSRGEGTRICAVIPCG